MDRTSVWLCCILGGLIMLMTYGTYGLVALKHIEVHNPVLVCFILGFLSNYGASFMVATTFSVLSKNFHGAERSAVVGIAKSWVGVSSGVGTAIFLGFFPSSEVAPERLHFLYFVAIVCGCIPMLIAPFMRVLPENQAPPLAQPLVPKSHTQTFVAVVSVVLIAVTLASSAQASPYISVVLICIVMSPGMLFLNSFSNNSVAASERRGDDLSEEVSESTARRSPWESGPARMIKRPECWLLWTCTCLLQGGGFFYVNNLGSLVLSRNGAEPGPQVPTASAVIIFSCTQVVYQISSWYVEFRGHGTLQSCSPSWQQAT
eukprot:gnl/MRDRNA2_/MRDRNA2_67404_c0_seq2.p1 gnl/MRDRNA2_/MRDRNA2_67404_c0~~gnl/MRDRNA2_/MRDRNA2_67404_c0_seq2.p1  ORF type:complete len:326 (-),score=33.19 gnl/MRDRNA2_/MRDRNA2_67404_c0_seq2:321-1271(-)